ncbi:MAG: hypothetical protein AAFV07_19415 [Bacteroidota bacterium]
MNKKKPYLHVLVMFCIIGLVVGGALWIGPQKEQTWELTSDYHPDYDLMFAMEILREEFLTAKDDTYQVDMNMLGRFVSRDSAEAARHFLPMDATLGRLEFCLVYPQRKQLLYYFKDTAYWYKLEPMVTSEE